MEKNERQSGGPEQASGGRGPQGTSRPAPGKVTPTSKLPGQRGRARQPKHLAPGASLHGVPWDDERGQQTGGGPVEDWTLVALRPDLHQKPILRQSRSEIGLADVAPPGASRSPGPGATPVQAQAAEEDPKPITVTGHPVHFEPHGGGLRVHVAWYVLERQAGREPRRLAEGQQPPRIEEPRLRVTTLVQRLEEHTGMRMQPGPRRELLTRQLIPLTGREPYVYTALLSEDELSYWFGQRAWQGYLDGQATGGGAEVDASGSAPRVTIEEVFRLVEEDDWDADTLAAQLDDAQMRTLSMEQRIRLLDHVSDGYGVDDEDEQTLIRLLATTPAAQAASVRSQLGAERLQQLEDTIDFAEYRDYHLALRALFFRSMSPEQAAEQMANAREFPWADPGFIHALWNKRFYYDEVELHDDGKLHVRYWTTWGGVGIPSEAVTLDPFEMIAVRFHYPEEYAGAERDQVIYMPAINLRSLHRKQFRQELQTVPDIGLLFLGGAGLAGAVTRLERVVAALELALGAADLVIRDFRHEIARSPEGRDFLAAWDIVSTLVTAYGVARLATQAPAALRRLRSAFARFRDASRSLPVGTTQRIESEVEDVLRQADEAGEAAAAAGQTAPTSDAVDAATGQSSTVSTGAEDFPGTNRPSPVTPEVPTTGGKSVTLEGVADAAHEAAQVTRFGQMEGGGHFQFLGKSSQGIEGFFTPSGSRLKIPVSLKDFSSTGNVRNILQRINRNATQVRAAGYAGRTVLHATVRQTSVEQMVTFISGGPLLRMPSEGIFSRLVFECSDGIVEITASGLVRR